MTKYRRWPGKWSKAEYARAIVEFSKKRGESSEALLCSLTGWMYIGAMDPIVVHRVAKHLKGKK